MKFNACFFFLEELLWKRVLTVYSLLSTFFKFLAFGLVGKFLRRRRRRRIIIIIIISCNSTNLSFQLVQQRFSSAYVRDGN